MRWSTLSPMSPSSAGPTIEAKFEDGPLRGKSLDVEVVEGRPPKIIDIPADSGETHRYTLSTWNQTGPSADYAFVDTV